MTTTQLILLAALIGQSALALPYHGYEHYDNYDHAPTPYHFEYGVKDPHTHDIKSQHEVSDGHGNVKGSYSLVEPDGSTRVVEYTADHEHGFNAKVIKIEAPHHSDYHHEPYHQPLAHYSNYY